MHYKKFLTIALLAAGMITMVSCSNTSKETSQGFVSNKSWEYEVVKHKNFNDLGKYIIEIPDYTDASNVEKGLALINSQFDKLELAGAGCTAMAKKNSKGEVIFGRNMDLDISQCPAFIYKTTFGKYENFGVTYLPHAYPIYADIQQMDELPEALVNMIPYLATDCFNEMGLYVETNLRERDDKLLNVGLHSIHGETTRADGKPWSELRAPTVSATQLISQNCATVKEAVEFLENSYDWYTMAPYGDGYTMINMAFLVGDATGEYGLIEIAQDRISYIPYQFGQANYYITPKWSALQSWGPGYGRLDMVSKVIETPQTLDEMMDAMKPIMWRNETLWLGQSKRMDDKQHQHPYDQVIFMDDKGNPSLDWRSEYVFQCPILEDGRMLLPAQIYEDAKKSTSYDPKIKEYFDEAIKRGQIIVDDGSIKFEVEGKKYTFEQLTQIYKDYSKLTDNAKLLELYPYEVAYRNLILRMDNYWLHNDDNFEAAKAIAYSQIHIRYNDNGEFDINCQSKYDKLCAFYGMGVEKDETPLRDDGHIWTTSLNVGVNCAQKEMKVRFWENDDIVYHVKF